MIALKNVYEYCNLLQIKCIKTEIESYIDNMDIKEIKLFNGQFECTFKNNKKEFMKLDVGRKNLQLYKFTNNSSERVMLDETFTMIHEIVEKRPNGIIFSVIKKNFEPSVRFGNKIVLTDLSEARYVFKKDTLKRENLDYDKRSLGSLLLKILVHKNDILTKSNFNTEFSTHMNYYLYPRDNGKAIVDNIYPTRTYLNDTEVSGLYDTVDGEDKLYRVYDLYRGIINPRNEKDISAISIGLLSEDAFDLKTLKGITKKEDELVGEAQNRISSDYLNYLEDLIKNRYSYSKEFQPTRDSILERITYKKRKAEYEDRMLADWLGLSYEKFTKMDKDEQFDYFEREKLGFENKVYVDGIPIDKEHVVTVKAANKKIESITHLSKNIFKRLRRKK